MEKNFDIENKLAELIDQAQRWQMNDAHTHASKIAESKTSFIEAQIILYVRQLEAKAN